MDRLNGLRYTSEDLNFVAEEVLVRQGWKRTPEEDKLLVKWVEIGEQEQTKGIITLYPTTEQEAIRLINITLLEGKLFLMENNVFYHDIAIDDNAIRIEIMLRLCAAVILDGMTDSVYVIKETGGEWWPVVIGKDEDVAGKWMAEAMEDEV